MATRLTSTTNSRLKPRSDATIFANPTRVCTILVAAAFAVAIAPGWVHAKPHQFGQEESANTEQENKTDQETKQSDAPNVHDRSTENTLTATEGIDAASAKISDVGWLSGQWLGNGLGGICHESWDAGIAGTMTGTFRLFENDSLVFSEFIVLTESDNMLTMRLKHFGGDMNAWEEKDDWTEFALLKLEPRAAWFDGLTYQLDGEGKLHVFVAMKSGQQISEGHFVFERQPDQALIAAAENDEAVEQPEARPADGSGFEIGVIRQLDSSVLGEQRQLNIFLPPGYEDDMDANYPVIYLLDGSDGEDYHHMTGLVQFLTLYELMPKSIVVGIANVDRVRDFTSETEVAEHNQSAPTCGGSAKFISFIEAELQPFILENYRTDGTRTLIGQSLGGLLATEIFVHHNSLFENYIIVSPSLWWNEGKLRDEIADFLTSHPELGNRLLLAHGEEGEEMNGDVTAFAKALEEHAPESLDWLHEHFPEETHATMLHRAAYRAFEFLYHETHPGME